MATQKKQPEYFGRYQVIEELGSGAMGVVYLCIDPRLARPVAVKVLKEGEHMGPQEREQYRTRFRHEAEAAGRLNHPDIVQVYDIGPSFMVMEFLEGRPLSSLLKGGTVLAVRQVASLVLRVADAIDYAHRNGVVHRDIKPGNIMVLNDGGVKVMDFGVARLDSSTLTVAGTVVGSVRYMAPEQMMGERVDGRADVFSLAAVAYELLTGRAPFPGKTVTEVVSRVVHGTHVPPRQADTRLPETLNAVFARAFAPRPKDRHSRAMDFARALHEALSPVLEIEVVHRGESEAPTRLLGGAGPAPRPARPEKAAAPSPLPAPRASARGTMLAGSTPGHEGLLLLDSDPSGARVYVDGMPVGQTPVAGVELAFGRHVVRMEAEGREPVSAEVELKPERSLKSVAFTLPVPHTEDGTVRKGQFVSFGPGVTPPRRIAGTLPAYPEAARERGLEGAPSVEVWVSEAGDIIDVAILESAGATLDGALLEAVAGWRFAPASLRGVPVSVRFTIQHLFRR
jgi:serine/threonine-protein kinase